MERKNNGLLINTHLGKNEEDLGLKTLLKNKKQKYHEIHSIRETWGINSSQKQKELISFYNDTKLDTSQDSLLGFINRSDKIHKKGKKSNKEDEKSNIVDEKKNKKEMEDNIEMKKLLKKEDSGISKEKKELEKGGENDFEKIELNFDEILEAIKNEEINLEKLEISKEFLKEVIQNLN